MNHYVYLIEKKNALPNQQKYYIGVRSCESTIWEDDYMSSSKYLTEDIEKNGKKEYNKIILKRFDNRIDANLYEIQMHDEFDVANNPLFFNKVKQKDRGLGVGPGELNPFYGKKHTEEYKQRQSALLKTKDCRQKTTNLGKKFNYGPKISAAIKERFRLGLQKNAWSGERSESHKKNLSDSLKKQNKYMCLHCDVVSTAGNLTRWHNDKCKFKGK
jgi:hypothetical protein